MFENKKFERPIKGILEILKNDIITVNIPHPNIHARMWWNFKWDNNSKCYLPMDDPRNITAKPEHLRISCKTGPCGLDFLFKLWETHLGNSGMVSVCPSSSGCTEVNFQPDIIYKRGPIPEESLYTKAYCRKVCSFCEEIKDIKVALGV